MNNIIFIGAWVWMIILIIGIISIYVTGYWATNESRVQAYRKQKPRWLRYLDDVLSIVGFAIIVGVMLGASQS